MTIPDADMMMERMQEIARDDERFADLLWIKQDRHFLSVMEQKFDKADNRAVYRFTRLDAEDGRMLGERIIRIGMTYGEYDSKYKGWQDFN